MEQPSESIQSILVKLVHGQEEQRKESQEIKKILEQHLLLHAGEHNKPKNKTAEDRNEEGILDKLRKDVQILQQEINIHNTTLQKLESSCSQVVKRKIHDHSGLLKRLEAEIQELKKSHEVLSGDLEESHKTILRVQGVLENYQAWITNLGQQMYHNISCLGSIITILQSIESASIDIKARLASLPVINPVSPQPNPEVGLDPSYLMQDLPVFTQEPQT